MGSKKGEVKVWTLAESIGAITEQEGWSQGHLRPRAPQMIGWKWPCNNKFNLLVIKEIQIK